jgi:hypothetical protein
MEASEIVKFLVRNSSLSLVCLKEFRHSEYFKNIFEAYFMITKVEKHWSRILSFTLSISQCWNFLERRSAHQNSSTYIEHHRYYQLERDLKPRPLC